MKLWQHEDTGNITKSETQPSNRWYQVPACEHGIYGCLMPGLHMASECHMREVTLQDEQDRKDAKRYRFLKETEQGRDLLMHAMEEE